MDNIKFVVEVNPRTKEKRVIEFLKCEITPGFTVKNLLDEHNCMKTQIKQIAKLSTALVKSLSKINKSTSVQLAEIKEEIK